MGLESFNVAPDNKGGRPSKEEEEESNTRRVDSAHTMDDDTEEYWSEMFNKHVAGSEPSAEELMKIASDTHLLSRTVKMKLTEFGVYEYDQFVGMDPTDGKVDDSPFGGSSSGSGSGLASIVNNAK